jgi:hypothetical protein
MDPETLLTPVYEACNRRDITALTPLLTADVDWPDQAEGGRLIGPSALAAYWARNDQSIHVEMAPFAFGVSADGRPFADLILSIHNLRGQLWQESTVRQLFTLRDGLIARMDSEPLARRN